MSYISSSDITDSLINSFPSATVNAKITLSDSYFNDFAESKGVMDSGEIKTDPFHRMCKDWCINWVCREICADNIGVNNNDVAANEKYMIKYEFYKERLQDVQGQITKPMITGEVYEHSDRGSYNNATIFRG